MSGKNRQSFFQDKWLSDNRFGSWLQCLPDDKTSAKCKLCQATIHLSNMGASSLTSHTKGEKHVKSVQEQETRKECANTFFTPNKLAVPASPGTTNAPRVTTTLHSFIVNEQVLLSEVIWAMKKVLSHYSLNSCEDVNLCFSAMFPDSQIAKKFSLGYTKCGYLLYHGVAPYCSSVLRMDINRSEFCQCPLMKV